MCICKEYCLIVDNLKYVVGRNKSFYTKCTNTCIHRSIHNKVIFLHRSIPSVHVRMLVHTYVQR